MKLISFNFDKVNIEKFSDIPKNIKIKNNVDILDITEVKNNILKADKSILRIKFVYIVDYEKDFAKVNLSGNMLFQVDSKIAEDILKKWDSKEIPKEFKIILFNIVLRKSNVKALQLEDDLNLPLHISLMQNPLSKGK